MPTCDFCAYPDLAHKSEKMPTSLFEKIVSDLSEIPASHPFYFILSRVNEPFLDKRLFEFQRPINRTIPHAGFLIYTNGSTLTAISKSIIC